MQANRSKGTRPEATMRLILNEAGIHFRRHVATMPGTPDFVLSHSKVAIFVDGDFWHGYRFGCWKGQLSEYWSAKIERNRVRDRRTFATLRRRGWNVVRVWEHQLADPPKVLGRILASLACATDKTAVAIPQAQQPDLRKRRIGRG
jgi:DNA mismatch endonuclease (patch repair protein)